MLSPGEVDGKRFDVVVIGSGMGGAAAALRAAELGLRPLIVEAGRPGGTCVNVGCVPTKYLLRVSSLIADARELAGQGVVDAAPRPRLRMVMARKEEIISQVISWYVDYVFPSYGVEVVKGRARVAGPHTVALNGGVRVEAGAIVVATGSEPTLPPIPGLGEALEKGYAITSDEALALEEAPESIVFIGGGPVGVELATLWHGMGSRVAIVEMMPRLLPSMDSVVGRTLAEILSSRGVSVYTGRKAAKIDAEKREVILEDGTRIPGEQVVVATGRRPRSRGLGLEEAGVKLGPRGEVVVDERMRTSVPSIYAVGDVTGEPFLASKAKAQGIVAAENIAGRSSSYKPRVVPIAVFSDPEAAGVGVQAEKGDPRYIVKRFPAAINYKSIVHERPYGVAKIVARREDEVLVGFHMVGLHASEVVNVAAVAIEKGLRLQEALDLVFSHPVMSEVFLDAMLLAKGVNVYLPKR